MKPQMSSLRKQEELSLKPAGRQEFQRWALKASCQDHKYNRPVQAESTNNVIFHLLLHAWNKQVPEG